MNHSKVRQPLPSKLKAQFDTFKYRIQYLVAKLLGYGQRDRSLSGARRSHHQDGSAGHFLGLDEVNNKPGGLASLILAYKASSYLQGFSSFC